MSSRGNGVDALKEGIRAEVVEAAPPDFFFPRSRMREAGKTLSDHPRSWRFARPGRKRTIELISGRGDDEDAIYIVVNGRLDAAGVPRLDGELRRATASAAVVILDLRELTLVDLAGALLIVRADLWIRANGGRLIVVRGGKEVERFFATIELDGLINFVDEPPRVTDPVAATWNFSQ